MKNPLSPPLSLPAICLAGLILVLACGRLAPALAENPDLTIPATTLERLQSLSGAEKVQELLDLSRSVFRENPALCREYLQQALVQAREINDYQGLAQAYNGLGAVSNTLGEYEQGQAFFRQALQRFELLEDPEGQAKTLQNIGLTQAMLGMYPEAAATNRRALALRRELGHPEAIAHSLNALANNYRDMDQFDQALAFSREALDLTDPDRDPLAYRRQLITLGTILSELDQPDEALGFLNTAEKLVRAEGTPYDLGFLLGNKGLVLLKLDQVEGAMACGQEALGIGKELQNPTICRYAHQILARAYEEMGQSALALEHLKEEMVRKDELFSDQMLQRVSDLTARLESTRRTNALLEAENAAMEKELDLEQARHQRRLLMLGLALSLIGGLVAVFLLQRARRAQQRLSRQSARLSLAMEQLHALHPEMTEPNTEGLGPEFKEFLHGKSDIREASGS